MFGGLQTRCQKKCRDFGGSGMHHRCGPSFVSLCHCEIGQKIQESRIMWTLFLKGSGFSKTYYELIKLVVILICVQSGEKDQKVALICNVLY